jgi:hypothetical protein
VCLPYARAGQHCHCTAVLSRRRRAAELFRFAREPAATGPVELSWLDVDRAFFIAMAQYAGTTPPSRSTTERTRLIHESFARDVWTTSAPFAWRTVAETFSEFVAELRLDGADASRRPPERDHRRAPAHARGK